MTTQIASEIENKILLWKMKFQDIFQDAYNSGDEITKQEL